MLGWLSAASVRASRSNEPAAALGIGGEDVGQDLDGDVATELGVVRPVHLAHAARADRRDDFVRAETGAGSDGHKEKERGDSTPRSRRSAEASRSVRLSPELTPNP